MSIKERLKTAYENVALNGDTTWTDSTNSFKEANKKLYCKERRLNSIRVVEERPRTVKDSIPNSKLAKYADYEYNEARELCYTRYMQKAKIEHLFERDENAESWLSPDVDELFLWYLCCQNQTRLDYGAFEICNEYGFKPTKFDAHPEDYQKITLVSPLLDAYGFQEKKLRMSIRSDRVRSIWNSNNHQRCITFTRDIELALSKLPGPQTSEQPSESTKDFYHLKDLARSFKEQNTWIAKNPDENQTKTEPIILSTKRLYSDVLQGISTPSTTSDNVCGNSSAVNNNNNSTLQTDSSSFGISANCCSCSTSTMSTITTILNSKILQQTQHISNAEDEENAKTQQQQQSSSHLIFQQQQDIKVQKSSLTRTTNNVNVKTKITPPIMAKSNEEFRNSNASYQFIAAQQQQQQPQQPQQQQPTTSISYVNNYNYQFNSFQNNCGCANTFSHTSQVITNRNVQAFQRQNHPFMPNQYHHHHHHQFATAQPVLMLQQNRTSVYPLTPPYAYFQPLQQTRMVQRWILPQNYNRNQNNYQAFVQQQPTSANPNQPNVWINTSQQQQQGVQQQQQLPSTSYMSIKSTNNRKSIVATPQITILRNKTRKLESISTTSETTTTTISDVSEGFVRRNLCATSTSSSKRTTGSPQVGALVQNLDFEEVVNKTVNILFEDDLQQNVVHPVTPTLSEELEIQALEQYCSSNDNVYQELERQAAEQYDEVSGNLKSPPIRDIFLGGLNNCCSFTYSIDVN